MKKLFAVGNYSAVASIGLLILRLSFGLTLLLNHGLAKLMKFSEMSGSFPDPLHVGHIASLSLTIFSEVIAAALLSVGLLTRFAALVIAIQMSVAFMLIHHLTLSGEHSGEPAFLYLSVALTILFAGPGKISLDKAIFK